MEKKMRTLIIEDELIARFLLTEILSRYGLCNIAVNGEEGVNAFKLALKKNDPYDLICLDIMMPVMDGQDTLKEIRSLEKDYGINRAKQSKIIMITALDDYENISKSYWEFCDGYVVKPFEKKKLIAHLKDLKLPV
jgi:two-component system chemotaxis response regulator CheY